MKADITELILIIFLNWLLLLMIQNCKWVLLSVKHPYPKKIGKLGLKGIFCLKEDTCIAGTNYA